MVAASDCASVYADVSLRLYADVRAGTVTWGLAPDPNGGHASSNKGALAVWRSKSILGPYEGPRDLIKSNVAAACVNTGTVVLGPDNETWYYLYDAIVPARWYDTRRLGYHLHLWSFLCPNDEYR